MKEGQSTQGYVIISCLLYTSRCVEETGQKLRQVADQILEQAQIVPEIRYTTKSMETAKMCIRDRYMEAEDAAYYRSAAKKFMKSLADHYAVKDYQKSNGQVLHSTYSNHSPYNTCNHYGVDECNLWGDYFYMEALTRLHKSWNSYLSLIHIFPPAEDILGSACYNSFQITPEIWSTLCHLKGR